MHRRELLSALGIVGAVLLTACATTGPPPTESGVFNFDKFLRWYKRKKLNNPPNPKYTGPGYQWHTFQQSIRDGWTPGIDWKVGDGTRVLATAPGEVYGMYIQDTAGRAGGYIVAVAHTTARGWPGNPPYTSHYAHLDKVVVNNPQKVKRGDTIGFAGSREGIVKLFCREHGNYVDPDNYGNGHAFMDYMSGPLETDTEIQLDPQIVQNRYLRQYENLSKLNRGRTRQYSPDDLLYVLLHTKRSDTWTAWSIVEQFRFLETLYEMHPQSFPDLGKEEFLNIRNEFYQNQPIIFSLPLKKG